MRKTIPFILLLDKRTLFNLNKKVAMPPDSFFDENAAAPHCNILKKIDKVMSKSDCNKDWNIESNFFESFMVLHVDEVNIK